MNAPFSPDVEIPVIFLDIDGVMNNEKFCRGNVNARMDDHTCFDPKSVAALAEILAKSGARLVLSSMWRYYNTLAQMEVFLELCGLKVEFLDRTPLSARDSRRGHEIAEWLEEHPEVKTYVILDDDVDISECEAVANQWIKTSWFVGLQKEHVPQALKLLGVEV